jgi:nucleoside-diphosphate-sugar epimerase
MEHLYLIGGSGFIGKNLAAYFSGYYTITVFDKYIDDVFFESFPNIKTVKLDLVEDHIPDNFDCPAYILNLASIVTAERDLGLFHELVQSNIKIVTNLYSRFRGNSRLKLFVQFGSSEEYGAIDSPLNEQSREEPGSPYALIKQLSTNLILMLYRNDNFPSMVVRPGNLFGRFQPKDKFIPYIIDKLKRNERLDVTLCEQKRDFIYIDDFATLIHQSILEYKYCQGLIINVASGESVSLKELIEHCKSVISSSSEISYGAKPYRANEIMDLRCDVDLLKNIIQRDFSFDLKDRLTQLIHQ